MRLLQKSSLVVAAVCGRRHFPSQLRMTPAEIHETIIRLVRQSDNPWLTGVCCINMDNNVSDEPIDAIFDTVKELREEYRKMEMTA